MAGVLSRTLRILGWGYWIFPFVLLILRFTVFRPGIAWNIEGVTGLLRDTLVFALLQPIFYIIGAVTLRERLGFSGYVIAGPMVAWAALGWSVLATRAMQLRFSRN